MKKSKNKPYNLLMYVENSTPKMKKFDDFEEMGKFVAKFEKKYPSTEAMESGYWIDFVISDISGEVTFFTDGIELT